MKKNLGALRQFYERFGQKFVQSRITTGREHQCQWTMCVTHHKVWTIGRNGTVCKLGDSGQGVYTQPAETLKLQYCYSIKVTVKYLELIFTKKKDIRMLLGFSWILLHSIGYHRSSSTKLFFGNIKHREDAIYITKLNCTFHISSIDYPQTRTGLSGAGSVFRHVCCLQV